MANTTITGPGGSVTTVSGFNGKFTQWQANFSNPAVDITGFVDVGAQANASGGPIGISGTITAVGVQGDATSTPIPGTGLTSAPDFSVWNGSLTLTAYTGCSWAFNAVMTQIGATRSYNGRMEITFSYVSNGAITQTWATGA